MQCCSRLRIFGSDFWTDSEDQRRRQLLHAHVVTLRKLSRRKFEPARAATLLGTAAVPSSAGISNAPTGY